jgi:predicted amidohydrolase
MENKKIRVAILQLQVRAFSEQAENKEHILKFIEKAARLNPDLIVLPECAYPCYFLSPRIIPDYSVLGNLCEQFLKEVRECACKFQTFIALSLPEYIPKKNLLYNAAVLIGDDGVEIGRTRKSFLWHFDNNWFQPDSHYPVFDTKIGKIGMFICADGRQPEIARALSLQGAEILLDLTNLVTTGLERKNWTNPQADYIIPTRALENRVWIVMANKVGFEESSIQCCGKSAFFSPEGETILMASSDREEILFREIDLSLSHQKSISGKIDVLQNRRPEMYSYLTLPTSELPISKEFKKEIGKEIENPFAAVIQLEESPEAGFSAYQSKIEYFFHTL